MLRSLILTFTLVISSNSFAAHHSSNDHDVLKDSMITIKSTHNVKTTADKLEKVLQEKGMTVFIRINHSVGAKKANLSLPPTEVVVFGNPKVGTPLMQCSQSVAIDLPQKMLIWQDKNDVTWLSYNNPSYLAARHNISGCDAVLKKITGALNKFANAATN